MSEQPCQPHRPGYRTAVCRTGVCGFCGTDLRINASGECHACVKLSGADISGGTVNRFLPIAVKQRQGVDLRLGLLVGGNGVQGTATASTQ